MNREEAKLWIPLFQAIADGKELQILEDNGEWYKAYGIGVVRRPTDYRIKPEPKLRPWTKEEVPRVFVVKSRDNVLCVGRYLSESDMVRAVGPGAFAFDYSRYALLDNWKHVHEDGTERPCGILSEEA